MVMAVLNHASGAIRRWLALGSLNAQLAPPAWFVQAGPFTLPLPAALISGGQFWRVLQFARGRTNLAAAGFEAALRIALARRWLAGLGFGLYLRHPIFRLAFKRSGPEVDRSAAALVTFATFPAATANLQRLRLVNRVVRPLETTGRPAYMRKAAACLAILPRRV